jgi:hypothetical protein
MRGLVEGQADDTPAFVELVLDEVAFAEVRAAGEGHTLSLAVGPDGMVNARNGECLPASLYGFDSDCCGARQLCAGRAASNGVCSGGDPGQAWQMPRGLSSELRHRTGGRHPDARLSYGDLVFGTGSWCQLSLAGIGEAAIIGNTCESQEASL